MIAGSANVSNPMRLTIGSVSFPSTIKRLMSTSRKPTTSSTFCCPMLPAESRTNTMSEPREQPAYVCNAADDKADDTGNPYDDDHDQDDYRSSFNGYYRAIRIRPGLSLGSESATVCVSAVFAVARCLSIRPSVTFMYCIQITIKISLSFFLIPVTPTL